MIPDTILAMIENRYGQRIKYSKDCISLSANIERVCGQQISSTTLKRLFGFAKTVQQPRMQTLDILALFVGHKDWHSLLTVIETAKDIVEDNINISPTYDTQKTNLLHHQVALALGTNAINKTAVIALCKDYGSNPQIFPFIINLITIAANQKDVKFLKSIYDLPVIFDETINNRYDFYYVGQTLGLVFRQHNDLFVEIKAQLASHKKAQQYFIEWFVDEDYLQGYYGELLDAYHKHRNATTEELLFYYCLKYNQAVESTTPVYGREWYNKIKTLKLSSDVFCIPAGRYVGICLAEEPKHNYNVLSPYYSIIHQFVFSKSYSLALPFMFYLCRELYRGKRIDWLVGVINDYEQHFKIRQKNTVGHWELKVENQLLIYIAFANVTNGNRQQAKKFYNSIDTNLFEPFIYKHVSRDYNEVGELMKR